MRAPAGWRIAASVASLGTLLLMAATPAWASAGNLTTVAGSASGGGSGNQGYLQAQYGGNGGDGNPATSSKVAMWYPQGVAVDAAGDIFIADTVNNVVRVVPAKSGRLLGMSVKAGDIYTVAGDGYSSNPGAPGFGGYKGDGGPAVSAELNQPESVAVDAAGNLYIADSANNVIREVAASDHWQYGIHMQTGDIYTIAGTGKQGFANGHGLARGAELSFPEGIALDRAGNLFIADSFNNRIREVPAAPGAFGGRSDLPFNAFNQHARFFGFHLRLPMDGRMPAHILTVAGNGTAGLSGDGGRARTAELNRPMNIAADARGDIFFTDQNNGLIREIAGYGHASFGQRMRRGHIYRLAGGGAQPPTLAGVPAAQAQLNAPWGIAVDRAGDVIFSEYQGYTLDILAAATRSAFGVSLTAGDVSVVAGIPGHLGCGEGPGTSSRFTYPAGIALDVQGNLEVADSMCERVAQLSAN